MKLRFGDIRFDSTTRQLWRGVQELHVSGKAFALLKLLLERRPEAVSKNEIQEHLWPQTFVSEANLPSLITEIRDAIGDDAKRPSFIRTLHGFGYAFSGQVDDEALPSAWLVWEGRRIPLLRGETILGREGEGVIAFDSTTVSRHHARIVIDGATRTIQDIASKNGTFVNDERVEAPRRLGDGDQVRMGAVLLTFREAEAAVSTETQASATQPRAT